MSLSHSEVINRFVNKGATKGKGANMFIEGDVLYDYGHHFPMLVRTDFGLLLNADKYSSTTSHHQSMCMEYAKIQIPFSVLRAANLIKSYGFDKPTFELIKADKQRWDLTGKWSRWVKDGSRHGKTETISNKEYLALDANTRLTYSKQTERRPEASIIKQGDKYYLSSMDGWNYFMCLLPEPATTIKDAFASLKPKEVGKKFVRQGEWFFVEATELPIVLMKDGIADFGRAIKTVYKAMTQKFELPKKRPESNSHIATRGMQVESAIYVSGQVRHVTHFGGRGEHRMLVLSKSDKPKIFRAYENRAIESYSASGRVD